MTPRLHTCSTPSDPTVIINWAHDLILDLSDEDKEHLRSCAECAEHARECFNAALRVGKLTPKASQGKAQFLDTCPAGNARELPPFPVAPVAGD